MPSEQKVVGEIEILEGTCTIRFTPISLTEYAGPVAGSPVTHSIHKGDSLVITADIHWDLYRDHLKFVGGIKTNDPPKELGTKRIIRT